MKSSIALIAGGVLFLAAAPRSLAHHSFMAEFDAQESLSIEGTVVGMQWQNPHTLFQVDAKDDKTGKIVRWTLETGSPNALEMRGWTRTTLKVGDHVSVHGYRAKNGSHTAAARSVTMANGKTMFGGQTDDGGPTQ